MSYTAIPWALAFLTAVWFGLAALKAGRRWILWALGGAVFGLITATVVFGLGHAAFIPFSRRDRVIFHLEWTGVAIVVIAVIGWFLTFSLRKRPPSQGGS